jgi:hypothetical protein
VTLNDLEASEQLSSCGGSTVTDIVPGLLRFLLKKIHSQGRIDFESVSDANLYLCIASPSGMIAAQETVVLSVLQDFESYKPAAWTPRMRRTIAVDLPEPVCTVGSSGNRVIEHGRAKVLGH